MAHTTFNNATTEQKISILEFLEEERAWLVFTCKSSVINYFERRDIDPKKNFQNQSLKVSGAIIGISTEGWIKILHRTGKKVSFPIEYLENVSLKKK